MTAEEWHNCSDPTPMLRFLQDRQTSDRKLRLLMCACCRQIWHLLDDPRSRQAVEVSERFADGQATALDLARVRQPAMAATGRDARQAAWAAYWATTTKAAGPADNVFSAASAAPARLAVQEARTNQGNQAAVWNAMQAAGVRDQVRLIREVIGDPFRPPLIEPAWLAWSGGLVGQLAWGIYEDRAFDRMPVLGDALEEAGCQDESILQHCRQDNPHVRGCWVVDLILSKDR